MAILFICVMALLSVHEAVCGLAECAPGINDCAAVMFAETDAAGYDDDLVCQAVDKALSCIANQTADCDILSKAELAGSMLPFLQSYQGPEYNCTLENANNPAFDLDACTEAISDCTNIYYEAQFSEMSVACQLFEQYTECMTTNTSACTDQGAITAIKQAVYNATVFANSEFYFCEERKTHTLEVCDTKFDGCVAPISDIGVKLNTSGLACPIVETMNACVEQLTLPNNTDCSPRQSAIYQETIVNLSIDFQGTPFYCGSANPCLELFKNCNVSQASTITDACSVIATYQYCLSSVKDICDTEMYVKTASAFISEMISLKAECETSTTETTTTTTTSTTTTTTTASTVPTTMTPTTTPTTTTPTTTTPTTTSTITSTTISTDKTTAEATTTTPGSTSTQTTSVTSGNKQTIQNISGMKQTTQITSGIKQTTQATSGIQQTTQTTSGIKQTTQSTSGNKQTTEDRSGHITLKYDDGSSTKTLSTAACLFSAIAYLLTVIM